ncbi:MAG TPA: hypothetical protein VI383_03115 [Gemmatimonadales bacterium]|nr:hypothetical protein [Gemmatimonadales bacterium]
MTYRIVSLAFAGILALGCSGEQRQATGALAAADSALASLSDEVRGVMPEQVAAVTEAVGMARQSIEAGDYKGGLASLGGIADRVQALADSAPARRAALAAEMNTLSVAMPRNLEVIKAALDRTARRRPTGLHAQQLEEARATYAAAGGEWTAIRADFDAGKPAEAINRAHDLKARVSLVMLALGLVADERAWSNVTLP